jgi:hypothetical protein
MIGSGERAGRGAVRSAEMVLERGWRGFAKRPGWRRDFVIGSGTRAGGRAAASGGVTGVQAWRVAVHAAGTAMRRWASTFQVRRREGGWMGGRPPRPRVAARISVRGRGRGDVLQAQSHVAAAVCSCGNPAWWSVAEFPTGVGRSGGGCVVARSFPYPVRFHSRGGRLVRLRSRGCLARRAGEVRTVPGVPRAVPGASPDCRAHLRGRIFRPPPPPAFGSALSRILKSRERNGTSAPKSYLSLRMSCSTEKRPDRSSRNFMPPEGVQPSQKLIQVQENRGVSVRTGCRWGYHLESMTYGGSRGLQEPPHTIATQ